MKIRDLFFECSIRLDPAYMGWSVVLVDSEGVEWPEHHDTRGSALQAVTVWMELFDDESEIEATEVRVPPLPLYLLVSSVLTRLLMVPTCGSKTFTACGYPFSNRGTITVGVLAL